MTAGTTNDGQLAEWSAAFDAALERAHALTDELSREQLNFKPGPDRWSVGQCIDHLSVSMEVYLEPMESMIREATLEGEEPYGRGPWVGRFLLRALRKPGKRYPAPRSFRPARSDLDPDRVSEEFDRQMRRMQRALDRCAGLALGEIGIPWPVFGLVEISLAQAFELQVLHTERHLDQAERVLRADDFPT